MHRNTYVVILTLSVFAALIIGVQIGKSIQSPANNEELSTIQPTLSISPTPLLYDVPTVSSQPASVSAGPIVTLPYAYPACGVSLAYPNTHSVKESTTKTPGVIFTDTARPDEMIVLTCQMDIPRPPIPENLTELIKIGSVSGMLYHETSAKNGQKSDIFIFTHPKNKFDVFIGGYGAAFNAIIRSIRIQ